MPCGETIFSPAKACPRAIPTRSATAFPTRSWISFSAKGRATALPPKDLRVACETLATTNRVIIAGETRGPKEITQRT